MTKNVNFIHFSDTHFGSTESFDLHGANTYRRGASMVEAINKVIEAQDVDFVVHTGDVCTDGDHDDFDGRSLEIASRVLNQIKSAPLVIINGNHDDLETLERFFPTQSTPLSARPLVEGVQRRSKSRACVFEVKERSFVTLDARPLPIDPEYEPRGTLQQEELAALKELCRESSRSIAIFMHYPPMELDCPWIDDWMTVKYPNGTESLHEILQDAAARVEGVYYGHVHRGTVTVRDSIVYASVGASSCHFTALPRGDDPTPTCDRVAFFNFVTLTEYGPIVKQYWVECTD